MAVLRFNCFTMIPYLYLLITLGLIPRTDCIQSKSSSITSKFADTADPTTDNDNFFQPDGSSSIWRNRNNQYVTSSPSSLLSSSFRTVRTNPFSTSTLDNILLHAASNNPQRKLLYRNNNPSHSTNTNRNNKILILSNASRKSAYPSYLSAYIMPSSPSYLEKQMDGNNKRLVTANSNQQRRNSGSTTFIIKDHDKKEATTATFEGGQSSDSGKKKKRVVVPPGKSISSHLFSVEQGHIEKVGKTTTEEPFPVAHLMNVHYKLDSPFLLSKFLDIDGASDNRSEMPPGERSSGRNNDEVPFNSRNDSAGKDDNDVDPSVMRIENLVLALPLQSSDDGEISPELRTLSPEATTLSEVATTVLSSSNELETSAVYTSGSNETTDEDKLMLSNETVVGTIPLRGKCNETIQCHGEHVECRLNICKCQLGYLPRVDNGELCGEASAHHVEIPTTDPTMIGVVVGLALMSVTLCIVLRLFAKARFRENRTIFNTPNPRLMNVSLLKGSKTLLRGNSAGGGQRSRRGSQASMNSGQVEGQSSLNANTDGNSAVAGSSHPHRVKPTRTLSTDTTNLEGTPASSRPLTSGNRSKLRQDSVASNV